MDETNVPATDTGEEVVKKPVVEGEEGEMTPETSTEAAPEAEAPAAE